MPFVITSKIAEIIGVTEYDEMYIIQDELPKFLDDVTPEQWDANHNALIRLGEGEE
jgi:hypothetical protein